jgi:deoxyribodipyrimidine photo-lyase
VPELRGLRGNEIHDPSSVPALARATLDYPEPIVDRAGTRERVLAAFGTL